MFRIETLNFCVSFKNAEFSVILRKTSGGDLDGSGERGLIKDQLEMWLSHSAYPPTSSEQADLATEDITAVIVQPLPSSIHSTSCFQVKEYDTLWAVFFWTSFYRVSSSAKSI